MKAIELLKKYPLTAKKIQGWYMDKLVESLKDESIDEDYKKHVINIGIPLDKVAVFIDVQPRGLFDIFDENNLIIEILLDDDKFRYKITNSFTQESFPNRKEAEKAAITVAFDLMENNLIKDITVN